jgi:hypothetical protein
VTAKSGGAQGSVTTATGSSGSVTSLGGAQQQTANSVTTVNKVTGDSSATTSGGGTGSITGSQLGVSAASGIRKLFKLHRNL